jgi:head-tail adaptor
MRAGKLDRSIVIERGTHVVDEFGTPVYSWTPLAAPMRAQVVEASTTEYIRNYGASSENVTVFRTRWLDGVTLADRVVAGGTVFDLQDMKEIGRRRGLELRCVAKGA